MLLKLQWLTDIFDWLHHNWERTHVQRKVALVIFWIYVAALCCVELKRQGMLPPALAQLCLLYTSDAADDGIPV